jgi:hypothetical protein
MESLTVHPLLWLVFVWFSHEKDQRGVAGLARGRTGQRQVREDDI